jgi:hypothetical protein
MFIYQRSRMADEEKEEEEEEEEGEEAKNRGTHHAP